jgi:hypothetical protein
MATAREREEQKRLHAGSNGSGDVDLIRAAPVLARARRAFVVGDPRQLRHVSFTSDADISEALAAAGVTELAYQPAGPDIPGELERMRAALG